MRDYGTGQWDGGDAACDHKAGSDYGEKSDTNRGAIRGGPFKETCRICGARRIDRQIGLERTPDEYVQTMVEVFRLVREVLADDGTLWLNLGDSYAGHGGLSVMSGKEFESRARGRQQICRSARAKPDGELKAKDLCGIPWRVAFALQADGWYLRSDIIWSKPNPMPESVTDRPTKAHEYLFLLSKRERYFYDAAAIAEPASYPDGPGNTRPYVIPGQREGENANLGGGIHKVGPRDTRNRRTVWTIGSEPFPDAHFATFPTALVEPCILAGSRPGDLVLDPFMGSGTVAQVAQSLGRRWLGCEMNPDYVAMQNKRAAQMGMAFA